MEKARHVGPNKYHLIAMYAARGCRVSLRRGFQRPSSHGLWRMPLRRGTGVSDGV